MTRSSKRLNNKSSTKQRHDKGNRNMKEFFSSKPQQTSNPIKNQPSSPTTSSPASKTTKESDPSSSSSATITSQSNNKSAKNLPSSSSSSSSRLITRATAKTRKATTNSSILHKTTTSNTPKKISPLKIFSSRFKNSPGDLPQSRSISAFLESPPARSTRSSSVLTNSNHQRKKLRSESPIKSSLSQNGTLKKTLLVETPSVKIKNRGHSPQSASQPNKSEKDSRPRTRSSTEKDNSSSSSTTTSSSKTSATKATTVTPTVTKPSEKENSNSSSNRSTRPTSQSPLKRKKEKNRIVIAIPAMEIKRSESSTDLKRDLSNSLKPKTKQQQPRKSKAAAKLQISRSTHNTPREASKIFPTTRLSLSEKKLKDTSRSVKEAEEKRGNELEVAFSSGTLTPVSDESDTGSPTKPSEPPKVVKRPERHESPTNSLQISNSRSKKTVQNSEPTASVRSDEKKRVDKAEAGTSQSSDLEDLDKFLGDLGKNDKGKKSTPIKLSLTKSNYQRTQSKRPEKFSLEQMLLDEEKKGNDQVQLKRKREEMEKLGYLNEELPEKIGDVIDLVDEILGTPKKKRSESNSTKRQKKSSAGDGERHDPLKMNLDGCDGLVEGDDQKNFQKLYEIGDGQDSEKKQQIGGNRSFSSSSIFKPEVKKIFKEEDEAQRKANYNRGNRFREIFDDRLARKNLRLSSVSEREVNPHDHRSLIDLDEEIRKVCDDGSEILELKGREEFELLKELVENLNFGIKRPTSLSIDLMRCLPISFTRLDNPKDQDEKEEDELEELRREEKSLNLIQRIILNILYRSISGVEFPMEYSRRCIHIFESCIQNFNYLKILPQDHNKDKIKNGDDEADDSNLIKKKKKFTANVRKRFWQKIVENTFVELGLKEDFTRIDENDINEDLNESDEDEYDDYISGNVKAKNLEIVRKVIEKIDLVVQVSEKLVLGSCLDLVSQAWLFSIGLRLGLDPRLSELRPSVESLIRTMLNVDQRPNGTNNHNEIPKNPQTEPSSSSLQVPSTSSRQNSIKISYLKKLIEVGIDVKTWKNKLELVRLIPRESEFKKWSALGLLEFSNEEILMRFEDDLEFNRIINLGVNWMFKVSNEFKSSPSPRDLYETLKGTQNSNRSWERSKVNKIIEGQLTPKKSVTNDEGDEGTLTQTSKGKEREEEKDDDKDKKGSNMNLKRRNDFRSPFDFLESPNCNSSSNLNESEAVFKGRIDEDRSNDQQINSVIEIYQICFNGIWDYVSDPKNQHQFKKNLSNGSISSNRRFENNNSSNNSSNNNNKDEGHTSSNHFFQSGNVWINLIERSLNELDNGLKQNVKCSNEQADRVKLKNSILRLSSSLALLNRDSFLNVKEVGIDGQYKLDKFFKK